jgi:hypothetical protein
VRVLTDEAEVDYESVRAVLPRTPSLITNEPGKGRRRSAPGTPEEGPPR